MITETDFCMETTMTFDDYYEIYKVRNPGKLDNINKKTLEDFWDNGQAQIDELGYADEIADLKKQLRESEDSLYESECEYSSALSKIDELEDDIDELNERIAKME